MSTKATEIYLREQTKTVIKHLTNGELSEAKKIILNHSDILRYNFGLINFLSLIPRVRFSKTIPRTNDALKMLIETGFEVFNEEENVNELLFFAAAKCDEEKLQYCVKQVVEKNPSDINQVREGDTALMFMIKYGNIGNEKFPICLKILIDSGIDVNRNDYGSHNPLGFLLDLYGKYVKKNLRSLLLLENLKSSIQMLLNTGKINFQLVKLKSRELTLDELLNQFEYNPLLATPSDLQKDKLFKFLINNDEKSFIEFKQLEKFCDEDDGNNTLLQLCCEKNLKQAAKFLLKCGANPEKTTDRNQQTPLELAARRNYFEIFKMILDTNKVEVTEQLFLTFLRARPKHIKAIYFEEILKYKNLDLTIKSSNGNSPLHYAIIFSCADAIEILLKRGASLLVQNDSKKCPLDYISSEDLDKFLSKCIVPDSYNDINNGKYELSLNYQNLISYTESSVLSEVEVVEKIVNSPKLCHLINHPLISSFLEIKWKLTESLYMQCFFFQIFFYLISLAMFMNVSFVNYLLLPLCLLYVARIWAFFNWKMNKFHESIDISIFLIIFSSLWVSSDVIKYHLGILASVFMAFSFHLFWRFSPNFSRFHALLLNVFSQFLHLLLYVLSLILFFGSAFYFYCLVQYEKTSFVIDLKSISFPFFVFSVFSIFIGVMIVMIIINLVTYFQDNSNNLKKEFQIVGYKNTLIFLKCLEIFYLTSKFIPSPFIFDGSSAKNENKKSKNKSRFRFNYLLNLNKFAFEKLIFVKLSDVNVFKIRQAVSK